MRLLTPDGYRDAAEVEAGALLSVVDLDGHRSINRIESVVLEVTDVFDRIVNGRWRLNGNQSIWANGNVTHVKRLRRGDKIYDGEGRPLPVISLEVLPSEGWWRLNVDGDHSYVADDLLLHNANRFWVGGTDTWNGTAGSKWSATSGGAGGAAVPLASDDVFLDSNSGSGTVTVSGTRVCLSINFSGFIGTLTGTSTPIISVRGGAITLGSGMTYDTSASTPKMNWIPLANSNLTMNGIKIQSFQIGASSIGSTGFTLTLQDAATFDTITSGSSGSAKGTFNTNGQNVTVTGQWTDAGNGIESWTFGASQVTFSAGAAVDAVCSITSPVSPGTATFIVTDSGANQHTISNASARTLPSVKRTAGTGNFILGSSSGSINDLDLTGFAGTLAGESNTLNLRGSLTIPSGVTVNTGTGVISFIATSGTKTIATNGVGVPRPITFNGVGGTFQLSDALNISGTRTVTLTNGTLDLNGFSLTADGQFSTSNANVRAINSTGGTGTIQLSGTGTVWDSGTSTNLTVGANVCVKLTNNSATGKTFAGGGGTFKDVWNATAGSGTLTFSGSNTFKKLLSSAGRTMIFTAGTTTTLTDFPEINGVYNGTKTTLQSSSAGSAWTISKATGIVVCDWLSLQDSTAAGGATWYAANSTNVSGNSGWIFAAPGETVPPVKGKSKKQTGRGGGGQWLRQGSISSDRASRTRRRYVMPPQTAGGGEVPISASDTLLPSVGDVAAILASLSRSDGTSLLTSEAVSLAVILSRSDAVSVASAIESTVAVSGSFSLTDSAPLTVSDAASIVAALARADALSVSTAEVAAILVALARGDSVPLALSDAADVVSVLALVDGLSVSVADVVANLSGVLSRSDQLTVSTAEAIAVAAALSLVDEVRVTTQDVLSVLALLSRTDAASVSLGDVAGTAQILSMVDELVLSSSEAMAVAQLVASLVLAGIRIGPALEAELSVGPSVEGDATVRPSVNATVARNLYQ